MFEGFVNPALVIGTGLAVVPLLIHLLNRQRHRPMVWGAMQFVLAAYRKTRRRVQIENLLLLLLRMGAVALLALCVARPFAGGDGSLGPLTEERRDLVVILDASASTSYREDVETVFERCVRRASALLEELDGPGGDRAQLVLMARAPRALGWAGPDNALALLPTLAPSDERADFTAALGKALTIVKEDAAGTGSSRVEVRVLCDLQRDLFRSLTGEAGVVDQPEEPSAEPSAEANAVPLARQHLDQLSALGVRVLVEDLGPEPNEPPNLSILAVRPLQPSIGARARLEIAVQVANYGSSPRPGERVALSVNGNKLPVQHVDLPAGGTAEAIFSFQSETPGAHALVAQLEGDRLAVDDRRAAVVVVPPPVSILVVNGSPSTDLDKDEVGYLLLALEPLRSGDGPASELSAPFEATEITPDELLSASMDLRDHDVIILAGVVALPEPTVEALAERVANGASLILSMGSRLADLEGTNRRLFRADGTGLLPAELVRRRVTSRRERYWRVATFEQGHPIFSFFSEELWRPLLTEIPIYTFVEARPLADARVLATLDDDAQSPLLVERSFDRGRVYLWTTSFSRTWSDIAASPKTLVPLMHEWMLHAGGRDEGVRDVRPGEPVSLSLRGFPRGPQLVRPDGSQRPLDGEPKQLGDGSWRLPPVTSMDTPRAGLYRIQLEGAPAEPFAVSLDPAEGNLARISPVELAGLHPALALRDSSGSGEGSEDLPPRRGEIWRWLALATLIFLVAESLWGARLGRRRRLAT